MFLPHDAVSWSAVCDCGLSWLYSITFCLVRQTNSFICISFALFSQWYSQIRTLKGDYRNEQKFPPVASLFKVRTSLKGKNSLPEGVNYFH